MAVICICWKVLHTDKLDLLSRVGNTYITIADLVTGEVINKQLISAGSDLPFREPEGMGIYIPNPKMPQQAYLYFGFASTVSAKNSSKLASIYGFRNFDHQ